MKTSFDNLGDALRFLDNEGAELEAKLKLWRQHIQEIVGQMVKTLLVEKVAEALAEGEMAADYIAKERAEIDAMSTGA